MTTQSLNPILQTAISDVMSQLNAFAQDPLFTTNLVSIFGQNAAKIQPNQFLASVNSLPTLEIQTASNLQGALGAFSTQTNTIYLSDSLLSPSQSNQLTAVLLEEIGHYLDSRLNKVDTKGDEGELFSAIVRGVSLSVSELSRIKVENDQAVITVNNQVLSVERSTFLVGYYDTPGEAEDVQIVDNYAYIADGGAGLQIINISNPANPIFVGNYDTSGYARDVQVVGNYAYVADQESGLQIINISNPVNPTLVSNYDISGWAYGVQISGDYAYMVDGYWGSQELLYIFDISNPNVPNLVGNYYDDRANHPQDIQISGDYAYIADFYFGLQIIDISNPSTPVLVSNYDYGIEYRTELDPYGDSNLAMDLQVVGNYAYIADENLGLQIIDISNPAIPKLVGGYDTPSYSEGVKVVGKYAYIADTNSGLQIIDISTPATPIFVGSYDTSGSAMDVEVIGNYAYIADGGAGLQIIDVSDPKPPNEAPTNITLSNSTLAENQAIGTVIGNFTTTDPNTGETFTYSLVAGTGDTNNTLFTLTGNQLRSNSLFDFETQNSYSICIRTTDQGGLFYDKQFTIAITNVVEQSFLSLTAQKDIFINEELDDTVTGTLANLKQNDSLSGGLGIDTLILTGGISTDQLSINVNSTTNQLNILGSTVTSFERFDLSGFLGTVNFLGLNTSNNWVKTGAGKDALTGGNANDTLNGGTGADVLSGLTGNDTYIVDSLDDWVVENLNGGTDTVESPLSWTLGANLENLTLTGTATLNGTGNGQDNIITGNSANNILDGGAGNDVLKGGAGDDTYLVDSIRDVVTENANEGQDLVQATVNTTLTNNVEDLTLLGTANINGTGNNANNILTGNSGANLLKGLNGNDTLSGGAGNDTLIGGLGNDRLVGEAGADQFLFGSSSAFKTSNLGVDTITDFTKNSDKIALSKVTFNALTSPVGTLQTAEFVQINSSLSNELSLVGSSSEKVVYNQTTGNLFYNPDGAIAGLTNGGQFASLSTRPSLTFADFTVQS